MRDKAAPAPTPACPGVELLLTGIDRADPEIIRHTGSCAFCARELRLFESFRSGEIADSDASAINAITARLESRAGEIIPAPPAAAPWWKSLYAARGSGPALVAIGASVLLGVIGIELRSMHPPPLNTIQSGAEVFRSPAIVSIVSPSGDVSKPPASIAWVGIPGATSYRVRVTEVDGHELWSAVTTNPSAALPTDIKAKIVPAKTLLLDVTAFDPAGRKIASSETTRFRFLQPFYRP
jgi:hypothetical protein